MKKNIFATIALVMGIFSSVNAQAQNEQVMNNGEAQKVVFNDYSEVVSDNFDFMAKTNLEKKYGVDKAMAHLGNNPEEAQLAYKQIKDLNVGVKAGVRNYDNITTPTVGVVADYEFYCLLVGAGLSAGFNAKDPATSDKPERMYIDWRTDLSAAINFAKVGRVYLYAGADYSFTLTKDYQKFDFGKTTTVVDKEVEGGIERTTITKDNKFTDNHESYANGVSGFVMAKYKPVFSHLNFFVKVSVGNTNRWNLDQETSEMTSSHVLVLNGEVGVTWSVTPARYNVPMMNKLGLSKSDVRKIARTSGKQGLKTLNVLASY